MALYGFSDAKFLRKVLFEVSEMLKHRSVQSRFLLTITGRCPCEVWVSIVSRKCVAPWGIILLSCFISSFFMFSYIFCFSHYLHLSFSICHLHSLFYFAFFSSNASFFNFKTCILMPLFELLQSKSSNSW